MSPKISVLIRKNCSIYYNNQSKDWIQIGVK
jgi:hypothetical protein